MPPRLRSPPVPPPPYTLQAITPDALDATVDALNRAFADYVIPITQTPATLRAMIARDGVDLGRSYLARDTATGAALGVALTAVRPGGAGPRVRVAAMGVAPEGRGRGVARALLARQLADARALGAAELLLECFRNNTRALALYAGSGFRVRRRLLGYRLDVAAFPMARAGAVGLATADPAALPDLARRCAEVAPPWQLEAPVLPALANAGQAFAILAPGAGIAGYIVLALPPGGAEARLMHVGVLPAWRGRRLATAALGAWLAGEPQVTAVSIPPLVPEDMPRLRAWLGGCGFVASALEQVEMAAPLGAPGD
jgi:ribosomal protein S18 acetylase RimI-like enzyme